MTSDLVRRARLEVQGVLLKAKDMTATFSFDIQIDPQDESLVILPILRFKHTPTTLLTISLQVCGIVLREITGNTWQRVGHCLLLRTPRQAMSGMTNKSLGKIVII